MDFSKDPCTDWTKFACEWRTLSSKSALNQQSELELKNENQVLGVYCTLQSMHSHTILHFHLA